MLWNFFRQALASPSVNVDNSFREMFNLSRSWQGCHPFAEEPVPNAPGAIVSAARRKGVEAMPMPILEPSKQGIFASPLQERLYKIKRGARLNDVAMKRSSNSHSTISYISERVRGRTSLAHDKRNIKMVGELFARQLCSRACAFDAMCVHSRCRSTGG